jgi:hypothetical protein
MFVSSESAVASSSSRFAEGSGRFYSPWQVAVGALLASPMGGCLFLAWNYGEMGRPEAKRQALTGGVVSTALVIGLLFVLPENFPNLVVPMVYTLTIQFIANRSQGLAYAKHIEGGGAPHSWWRVLGISLATLVVVLLALWMVAMLLPKGVLPQA